MNDLPLRILTGLIIAIGFAVSGYYRRRAAAADPSARRADEPTSLKLVRLCVGLPGVFLIAAALIAPGIVRWATFELDSGWRVAGVGLAAAGLGLVFWLFPHLGHNVTATALVKERHVLVTSGPYRWIRHPLYLAGLCLLVGVGLVTANWAILALAGAVTLVWLAVIIPREEAALAARFGAEYERYRALTGALLPRLARHVE